MPNVIMLNVMSPMILRIFPLSPSSVTRRLQQKFAQVAQTVSKPKSAKISKSKLNSIVKKHLHLTLLKPKNILSKTLFWNCKKTFYCRNLRMYVVS